MPAVDTLPRHAHTTTTPDGRGEDPAEPDQRDRSREDPRHDPAAPPVPPRFVPGAAPVDVPIPRNANLQSGHPGPHALDCLAEEPAGPPHVPDRPHRGGAVDDAGRRSAA